MTESADNRKISRLLSYTCGVCGLPLHLVFESFTKPVRWEHPEGTGGHPVELVRHEHEVDLDELPAPDKWAPGV